MRLCEEGKKKRGGEKKKENHRTREDMNKQLLLRQGVKNPLVKKSGKRGSFAYVTSQAGKQQKRGVREGDLVIKRRVKSEKDMGLFLWPEGERRDRVEPKQVAEINNREKGLQLTAH